MNVTIRRIKEILPMYILSFIVLVLAVCVNTLFALDFIPLVNVRVLGGQYMFQEQTKSFEPAGFGGNINVDITPAIKFNDKLSLIPSYYGVYRGTKDATELVGGGTLYQQATDHTVSVRLVQKMTDSLKIRLKTGYRVELLQETKDETWGRGLFDYQKTTFGLELENKSTGILNGFLVGAGRYSMWFPNYQSLAEEMAKKNGYKQDEWTELTSKVGKNVLDFSATELYANLDLSPHEILPLRLSYNFTLQNFIDQRLVEDGPSYPGKNREDIVNLINLVTNFYAEPNDLVKLTLGVGAGVNMYSSNQNHYDADKMKFIPKYYNFSDFKVNPMVNLSIGTIQTGLSYELSTRSYSDRLVQDVNGDYKSDKVNVLTNTIGVNCTIPILRKVSLYTQLSYRNSSSNMKYEKLYKYNYNTLNYNLGVTWEY